MLGFKVVRRERGYLYSATYVSRELVYGTDGWTVPPQHCGPLTCFKNVQAAFDFSDHLNNSGFGTVVYLCEYDESKEERVYTPGCRPDMDDLFYHNSHYIKREDTVFADRIRLMEMVLKGAPCGKA